MIFVVGANGQVGLSLQKLGAAPITCDITSMNSIRLEFSGISPGAVIINAAAYTTVDKAEDEIDLAFNVNQKGVENLITICKELDLKLIHISTDYVFDGKQNTPYLESDQTTPLGVYGKSKREGELEVISNYPKSIIVRTSWVYSEYRSNFLLTMLKLKEKESLSVVFDQVGSPTYASDLATALIALAHRFDSHQGEIFHYSNEGVCSWYDFAKEIFENTSSKTRVFPIRSHDYPTKAKRPSFSVLDKTKIKNKLNIEIPHWKESLKLCLKNLS